MGASTETYSAPPTSEPAIDKFPACAAGGTDKLGDSAHGVHCLTWISSCGRDQGILSRMQMACENASARGSHAQRNRISCSDWRLRSAEWPRRGSSVGTVRFPCAHRAPIIQPRDGSAARTHPKSFGKN